MLRSLATLLVVLTTAGTALAADPIEGSWKTEAGSTAAIAPCGGAFCITLTSGRFKGKSIGRMEAKSAGAYAGSITDPNNDKTYSGSASVSGGSMRLRGCVLGMFCRSQTWRRQ